MTRHDHEDLESLDILEAKVDRGHTLPSCGHRKFDEHLVGSQMDAAEDEGRESLCSSPNHENLLALDVHLHCSEGNYGMCSDVWACDYMHADAARHFVNVWGCGRSMKESRRL